ncbi:helix-turn-helix transcriptional regulator [Streptosporangium lutulentum]|uniref:Transcriptional regulator with XRE-family HTH domain n=1 Tax=Streptosporangium lutulentum TaxID=1461250 RepID=A0ABT9QKI5_9ACTN|nr:helix-turn-helix transcriptional regulator [Streptosporangium lutulentum]MDP9846891.1 transcriptional regulator with XRE-family HTH domain [Streptosporangium lutulentum]
MDSNKLLGEFLRAQREATAPSQVGLLSSGPRRTPGLRRDEVAMLAGVSADYYGRLEEGSESRPSEEALGALVRALGLGPEAAAHLYGLACPRVPRDKTTGRRQTVGPDLLRLMRSWPRTPAMVCGLRMDVLAMNQVSAVLYDGLKHMDNLLRMVFLDPAAREFYRDWEQVATARVAHLRTVAGPDLDDPYLTELIGELAFESADFRRMWSCPGMSVVTCRSRETKHFYRHPKVGDLALSCEVFNVHSAPGQQLITLHAEAGSPAERALSRLGSLADTAR